MEHLGCLWQYLNSSQESHCPVLTSHVIVSLLETSLLCQLYTSPDWNERTTMQCYLMQGLFF